jgi:GntR family transcriptional regulator/MocR family aminotransferase
MIQHLPYRSRHVGQRHPAGLDVLRDAIVDSISPLRGMSIRPENCIVISDQYRAIDIISRVIAEPIGRVAVEDPCDKGLRYLLKNQTAEIIPIPVDDNGIDTDRLLREDVQMVFVSPTHQQPTGATLSTDRRRQLLDWANTSGQYIVELDTFGEFFYEGSPQPSLLSQCSTPDRVIYVNSFTSWIGAGIQLCYMAVPDQFVEPFLQVKSIVSPDPAWIDQRVAADFISSDVFYDQLRRIRHQFKIRRDAILDAIEEHMGPQQISGKQAGRHLVWQLPDSAPSASVVRQMAAAEGIAVPAMADGYSCVLNGETRFDPARTLLLGYTAANEDNLRTGIAKLAGILSAS